jgi:hypothetical protein
VARDWEPGHFHAGRSTSPFQPACARSLEWEVPQRLDWEGWTNSLASQKPRSYPDGLFFCGDTSRTVCLTSDKWSTFQNILR